MNKAIKVAGVLVVMMTMSLTFSCSSKQSNDQKTTKEYTSEYVCPMHCEGSGDSKPGQCPVCGMDYVKNSEHTNH